MQSVNRRNTEIEETDHALCILNNESPVIESSSFSASCVCKHLYACLCFDYCVMVVYVDGYEWES